MNAFWLSVDSPNGKLNENATAPERPGHPRSSIVVILLCKMNHHTERDDYDRCPTTNKKPARSNNVERAGSQVQAISGDYGATLQP